MAVTALTGELVKALDATGKWWMIGRGKVSHNEPLFGCVIQEPRIGGKKLASVESDTLDFCIIEALERLDAATTK